MLGSRQVLFVTSTHRVWGPLRLSPWNTWASGITGPPQPFLHSGLRSSYSRTKKPIWRTLVMGKWEGHPVRSGSLSSEENGSKKFILVYKQTFDSSSHWWRRQQSTPRPLVWETKCLPQSKTSIYDLKQRSLKCFTWTSESQLLITYYTSINFLLHYPYQIRL